MPKPKEKTKPPPIKKVPLIMGLIFIGLGLWNLVLVFTSPESTVKAVHGSLVASFMVVGTGLLERSGIFER